MIAPREHDRKKGHDEQCPFVWTLDHKKSQEEQHADNGSHIDRTGSERLVTPVCRNVLAELLCRFLWHALLDHVLAKLTVTACIIVRRTTHIVRHKEGPTFVNAVAPGRCIVEIQALGLIVGIRRLDKVAVSASHRLFSIFEVGKCGRCASTNTNA